MKITLVSEDRILYRQCREVLGEIHGHAWELSAVASQGVEPGSDLYIWDFHPGTITSQYSMQSGQILILVAKEDLGCFWQTAECGTANILLKPLARAVLAASLSVAFAIHAAKALDGNSNSLTDCLIQTSLKLQEFDQDRTRFLAWVAHDFRSPVTALGGYCGLLLDGGLGPLNETQRTVLQRMQNSVNRLSRMVSALFELSVECKVSGGVDLRAGNIRESLDQTLHEMAPFALDKRITFTISLDFCSGRLYFDQEQTEGVLINLLENACKFTPKGGNIEIRGYPFFWERREPNCITSSSTERRRGPAIEPNSYRIDICNSGEAIPEDELERIFEEYTSLTPAGNHSGCGIGLAICRMIIAKHQGRVWAGNTELGPQFSFVLPFHNFEPPFDEDQKNITITSGPTVYLDAAV
jgi:signal transduction histidine kinase